MDELVEVRLLRPYRGYKSGTVIRATAGLASHLVQNMTGVLERQASLLEAAGRQTAERAVCRPQAAETRLEAR